MASNPPRRHKIPFLAITVLAAQALGAEAEAIRNRKREWTEEDERKDYELFLKVVGGLIGFICFLVLFAWVVEFPCMRSGGKESKHIARDVEAAREEDSTSAGESKPVN